MIPKLEKHLKGDKEHRIRVKLDDRYLIGFCDHYCPVKKILNENKTTQDPNRWNQVSVDNHGQLTMYSLMLFLRDGTLPHELEIWLNVILVENREFGGLHIPDPENFYRIKTERSVKQCLDFGANLKRTLKDMENYACTLV